ncbi:MAG: hypothetical protein DHS20C15_16030 [Planctomycetota bacterium]|nr:MAG: hypothetical protein DHS20C15_16030 [Planctomycetota bacterium]
MKASGEQLPRDSIAPFALRDGRLFLEGVALDELVPQLEGQPVRLVSRAAVDAALHGEPRCLGLDALEDPDLLEIVAAAGWWLRVRSRHELSLGLSLGFAPERVVAAGPVVDDGFLKEVLVAGVGALELNARELANTERIARLLQVSVPTNDGSVPPTAPPEVFGGCAAFLTAVLAEPPELHLDMAWPLGLEAFVIDPSSSGDESDAPHPLLIAAVRPPMQIDSPHQVSVRFLSRGAHDPLPRAAHLHGSVRRGDWVVLPSAAAALRAWIDPVHEPVQGLLVSESSWRYLPPRSVPTRDAD